MIKIRKNGKKTNYDSENKNSNKKNDPNIFREIEN